LIFYETDEMQVRIWIVQVKERLVQIERYHVQVAAPNIMIARRVTQIEAVFHHLDSIQKETAPVSAASFFISMFAESYKLLQESH